MGSEAHKGKKLSKEHIEKLSKSHTGKHQSREQIEKRKAATKVSQQLFKQKYSDYKTAGGDLK